MWGGGAPAEGGHEPSNPGAGHFAEKLKYRWADAAFRTWSRGQSILHGFWSRLVKGRLEDGTAYIQPTVAVGNAKWKIKGMKGRKPTPTSSMLAAGMAVCGRSWLRSVDEPPYEHRSSKPCSGCGKVLDKVRAPTPIRVKLAAAARKARGVLTKKVPDTRIVRGLLLCRNPACPNPGFKHRDKHAALNIRNNTVSVAAGRGGLKWMRRVRHLDAPPGVYTIR